MMTSSLSRAIGELAYPDIAQRLSAKSVLCLPLGAMEQHGPHLPLNTDAVIAREITRHLVARWGEAFDLWQLPTLSFGVSPEHAWAAGTVTLSIDAFCALLRDLGKNIARTFPTRNLVLVNCHGGNRGILQALIYELQDDFGLNVCVLHPLLLAAGGAGDGVPEIHAGKDETSLMLALAPDLVRQDVAVSTVSLKNDVIRQQIMDESVTWPWRSNERDVAMNGVTGDPQAASAAFGRDMLERIVTDARPIFEQMAAATKR